MKKIITLIAIFCFAVSSTNLTAQTQDQKYCTIKGTVQYFFNDYQGYKIDVGSEVMAMKVEPKIDSLIKYNLYNQYLSLVQRAIAYYSIINKNPNVSDIKSIARNMLKFPEEDEERFKVVCDKIDSQYMNILKATEISDCYYEAIVDGTGLYKLEVPYGEYYLIFKSNNRQRPTKPELFSRYEIQKVTINKPSYLKSVEFIE